MTSFALGAELCYPIFERQLQRMTSIAAIGVFLSLSAFGAWHPFIFSSDPDQWFTVVQCMLPVFGCCSALLLVAWQHAATKYFDRDGLIRSNMWRQTSSVLSSMGTMLIVPYFLYSSKETQPVLADAASNAVDLHGPAFDGRLAAWILLTSVAIIIGIIVFFYSVTGKEQPSSPSAAAAAANAQAGSPVPTACRFHDVCADSPHGAHEHTWFQRLKAWMPANALRGFRLLMDPFTVRYVGADAATAVANAMVCTPRTWGLVHPNTLTHSCSHT